MRASEILLDGFERVRGDVQAVLDGVTDSELNFRADARANTATWLVWHLTRVQDDHVAAAAGTEQVWTRDGWAKRFGLELDDSDTGYGHDARQVALVRSTAGELAGYFEAVHAETVRYVEGLGDDDLDRIVDRRWNPPVTLGVRLVSVISDDLQHVGQAAFLKGIAKRAEAAQKKR
ncbi:MAG TPA: DUF664 domain-containing protein [Acidimicrobiales bacterium]|nr:DUF664 domain-containing protein [Acidimicrobiales bacterium]